MRPHPPPVGCGSGGPESKREREKRGESEREKRGGLKREKCTCMHASVCSERERERDTETDKERDGGRERRRERERREGPIRWGLQSVRRSIAFTALGSIQ